jgi:hypothetical protein
MSRLIVKVSNVTPITLAVNIETRSNLARKLIEQFGFSLHRKKKKNKKERRKLETSDTDYNLRAALCSPT